MSFRLSQMKPVVQTPRVTTAKSPKAVTRIWPHISINQHGSISLKPNTSETAGYDVFALHSAILKGSTKVRVIKSLAQRLGIAEEELARRCGLSRATLHRRVKANASLAPTEADVWSRFALLFKQAVDVFEDEESARTWLSAAQPGLDGRIPLDLAQSTTGYREVEKLLTRIDHGVYA